MEKDHFFERTSVSGVVRITLDKELVLLKHFKENIRVNIVFHPLSALKEVDVDKPNDSISNSDIKSAAVGDVTESLTSCNVERDNAHSWLKSSEITASVRVIEDHEQLSKTVGPELEDSEENDETNQSTGQGSSVESEALMGEQTEEDFEKHAACSSSEKNRINRSLNLVSEPDTVVSKKQIKGHKKLVKSRRKCNSRCKSKSSEERRNITFTRSLKRRMCEKSLVDNGPHEKYQKGQRVRKLSLPKDVTCQFCSREFNSQQDYFDHRKKRGPEFNCKYCSKNVSNKAFLLVHMKVKHEKNMLEEFLESCSQEGDIKTEVLRNKAEASQENDTPPESKSPFKCDICQQVLASLNILKNHTMTHTKEMAYKCCVCQIETPTVTQLNTHLATHNKPGLLRCKNCNIDFKSKTELHQHQITHKRKTRSQHHRSSHQDEVFGDEVPKTSRTLRVQKLCLPKNVTCQFCLRDFKSQQEYFDHRKKKGPMFNCTYCSKTVSIKAFLLVHMKAKHGKNMLEEFSGSSLQEDEIKTEVIQSKDGAPQEHMSSESPYKCDICEQVLASLNILKNHTMIHTKEMAYKCCVCEIETPTVTQLNTHLVSHNKPGLLHCKNCNIDFKSKTELHQHQLTHKFNCFVCGAQFLSRKSRAQHCRKYHQDENPMSEEETPNVKISRTSKINKLCLPKDVTCQFCSRDFKSQQEYFDHRKKLEPGLSCKYCSKTVACKAFLMVHMKLKHGKSFLEGLGPTQELTDMMPNVKTEAPENKMDVQQSEQDLMCEICGQVLASLSILKNHVMTHTKEMIFKCCVCSHEASTVTILNTHMATHSRAGLIYCKVCNEGFASRGELSEHKNTHNINCSLCGAEFPNKTSRTYHYKTCHPNDILSCHICGKMYSSESELQSHVKYHSDRPKTQCPKCGIFVIRLNLHMELHNKKSNDDDLFCCDQCPKTFKRKRLLMRHRLVHSKDKKYSCSECSKKFTFSGGLRRHMATHSQEKPFVCDICGKACSQMGNLKIHMQIHKGSSPLACNVCGQSFGTKKQLQEHTQTGHSYPLEHAEFPPLTTAVLPIPSHSSVSQAYYP